MNKHTKKILAHIEKHPKESAKETAFKFNVGLSYVYQLRQKLKKMNAVAEAAAADAQAEMVFQLAKGKNPKWQNVAVVTSDDPLPVTMEEPAHDPVNHPAHYKVGGIETIDFIEAKKLNYNLGNAVKYITRADHKGNRKQDLQKAIWYLVRELNRV